MNISSLKNSFFTYLEEQGKLYKADEFNETEQNIFETDYSDISLYKYADEFKLFLQSKYDTAGTNLMGKSMSDLLKMEIEYGKLVDKSQEEAKEEEAEEEESESINENSVVSNVENKIEDELSSDMSSSAADTIVGDFEDSITDVVEEQIQKGYDSNFDIFKEVFNELTESKEFVDAIDVNQSSDIDQNELANFWNSIKGLDDNEEDVSVYDLLTSATQIQEGRFNFISTTNNSTGSETIKDTDNISSGDHAIIDSTEGVDLGFSRVDKDFDISGVDGGINDGSAVGGCTGGSGDLGAMTGELGSLQAEKEATEADLVTQTDKYDSAQDEKAQVVGELSNEIESGNEDLSDAQDDVNTTCQEKDAAACDLQTAQQETQTSKTEADQAGEVLDNAQTETDKAQCNSDTAADNNEQAIQTETEAQDESITANADLATAVENTGSAQGVADERGAELQTATVEATEAFSVLNVRNQEVAKAQSEYNNAKAQQDNASQSIFQRLANWVSNLFNALSDAIMQRDHAQAEADRKAAEQEKAQIASNEALEALEQRKEEQEEAQEVADAAQVVLDRATGAREVSDQEYAEALIALASAMEAEEGAESEYNTAFDNYIQCNNYQIDAEGRLMDAEGNYISATQVAKELETYVKGLVSSRDTKEKEYDAVIVATAQVIEGDKSKIQELDSKIQNLQAQIEQEKENIALQEAMITELSTEQSEINAANASGGIVDGFMSLFGAGNAKDQRELDDKKTLLEEALLTGDSAKIAEAYRAIYGDKEVIIDATGNVVDPSELTEEELAKCSVVNVKDLSDKNLSSLMNNDATAITSAAQTMEVINNGVIVCDGEEVSMDELNSILKEQMASMAGNMDDAVAQQGIISKFAGGINNFLGLGTCETEARAQVDVYQQLAQQLDSCTDPVEYAALFKQITGRDFSLEAVAELLAYNKVSKGESTETDTSTESTDSIKADITSYVNTLVDAVNEDENLSADSLSMTKDNSAREAIEDYKETQETAKDAVIGVVSGVVSTAVVTVCSAAGICATPFTGGASLGLVAAGFAIAGATGAAVSAGLNAADSIYDADGDGSIDFNYSWKECAKDALIGGLNGIVGNLSNGVGTAITGRISTQATQTAVTTTFSETIKNGAINTSGKLAGAAVEGFIDGSVGASGEYAINALLDQNVDFSLQQFIETGIQGGIIGSVFNVGLTTSTSGLSAISDGIKTNAFEADINKFLSEGTTNNKLAEVVASKLDDSLLDTNGMVNKYAVKQLMKNAENALDTLESYFKKLNLDPNDAIKVLDNISLADMPNVSKMILALTQLDIPGIDMTTPEGINDSLGKISNIETNPNGTLSSMKLVNDGQEIIFNFDSNGNLNAIGLAGDTNGINLDGDDVHIDGDKVHVDENDINIEDKYTYEPIDSQQVLDAINKLVDIGELPADIDYIKILNDPTNVSRDFYDDLTKLYTAYSEGIDIQKVFVPEFSNLDDAVRTIKVGDVCTVDGGKTIGIKLADGTIQNLNMSAETYMELFPPVKRFASMQGNVGDCFLISSLDIMYRTPETRVKLLQCFTENPDGTIDVKVGNVELTFNGVSDTSNIYHKDSSFIGINTNIDGASGFKMLEEVFGFSYIEKKSQYLIQCLNELDPSSEQYKEFMNLLGKMTDPNSYIGDIALNARANGGWMHDVFEIFGLNNPQWIKDPNAILSILSNQENWDKLIITLASKGTSDTTYINSALKLAGRHAYSVEPYLLNGQMMFKITNPWDCAASFSLTLDEILKYFSSMSIAEKV